MHVKSEDIIDLGHGVGVLPAGGREFVLRPGHSQNALWENPLFCADAAWPNPGGGRSWISPEADLFFPHLAATGRDDHSVPPEIDPGHYEIMEKCQGSITLRNVFRAHFWGGKGELPLVLDKRIEVLECAPTVLPEGIAFAGYRLTAMLRAQTVPLASQRPAIWNLLQVPPGGEICFDAVPETVYFGQSSCSRHGSALIMRVPSSGEPYKLGFRPPAGTRKRMFYWNGQASIPYFIMREFTVAERCADIPFPAPPLPPCPVQVFCDNGSIGGFGEMEYHSNYLTAGEREVTDISLTWAFAGPLPILRLLYEELCPK